MKTKEEALETKEVKFEELFKDYQEDTKQEEHWKNNKMKGKEEI